MSDLSLPLEKAPCLLNRTTENRRAAVRWHSAPATPGVLFLPDDCTTLIGWLTDLSAVGVGLLLSRPLEPDTPVQLELGGPNHVPCLCVEARVVRVMPQRGGDWIVGCEFCRPLNDEELDSVL
jgi:hypothetical protein